MKLSNTDWNSITILNPECLIIEDDKISDVDPRIIEEISMKSRRCCSNSKLMFFW